MSSQEASGRQDAEIQPTKETQALAKYIAMVVRNEMEDFHCEHLSDAQMRQLNPIIRNGICSALHAWLNYDEYENAKAFADHALLMIPDYWEEPEINRYLRRRSKPTPEELRELVYQQRPTVRTEDGGIIREVEIYVVGFDEWDGETQVALEITTHFGNEDEHIAAVWSGVGPAFVVDPHLAEEPNIDVDDD